MDSARWALKVRSLPGRRSWYWPVASVNDKLNLVFGVFLADEGYFRRLGHLHKLSHSILEAYLGSHLTIIVFARLVVGGRITRLPLKTSPMNTYSMAPSWVTPFSVRAVANVAHLLMGLVLVSTSTIDFMLSQESMECTSRIIAVADAIDCHSPSNSTIGPF